MTEKKARGRRQLTDSLHCIQRLSKLDKNHHLCNGLDMVGIPFSAFDYFNVDSALNTAKKVEKQLELPPIFAFLIPRDSFVILMQEMVQF